MLRDIVALLYFLLRATFAYLKAFYRLFVSPSKVPVRGRVIVITGSGSGLGRELALRFAAKGARLALWDISVSGNKKTAELIQSETPDAEIHLYTVDVTDIELIKTSALRVRSEIGDVHMLINNAGVLVGESLLELRNDDIRRTIEINLLSVFWTLRAFLPGMLESNSGHIVTTCSAGGQNAMHRLTDYCASKFGIFGLDEALESELRDVYHKTGIKQTLICPHFLDTGMIHSIAARGIAMNKTDEAADYIFDGILRQKRYIYFPRIFSLAPTLKELLPHEGRLALLDFIQTKIPSQSVNRPHYD
ncbi:short-chain dehydrogenase/reductase family 16C member 6-like [Lytechinus pictus]|uniref:short-chain dehydrogenase/reductase family 16C member 6-like n=1 Tax=Lytechinus pictus TaxID=7653 RepID=UPI0030B9EB38